MTMTAGDIMSLSRSADATRLQAPVGGNNSSNILQLCIGRNKEISVLLNEISEVQHQDYSVELRKNNEIVTKMLDRLTTDYGDVDYILDISQVEPLLKLIMHYRKKLAKFTERRGLGIAMLQTRFLKKMDVASNAVSLKLAEIDRLLKQTALDRLKEKRKNVFQEMMKDILKEDNQVTQYPGRANSIVQREREKLKSAIDHSSIKSSEVRIRLSNDSSIIKGEEKKKMLGHLRLGEVIVRPLVGDVQHKLMSGAGNDESEHSCEDSACGQTISTYPIVRTPDPQNPDKMIEDNQGLPIADKFSVYVYENRVIPCVADGCGGRDPPREAATRASRMFTAFISRYQHQIRHVTDAADIVLQALHAAHESIMYEKNPDLETIGQTTITGGIVLEVDQESDENGEERERVRLSGTARGSAPFIFVCGTIGDCKAFRICGKTKKCTEITKGNRGSMNVRDPGGSIGSDIPDLRNLVIHTVLCDEGDLIVLLSDGVHDNLTPKSAGLHPSDVNIQALDDDWQNVASDEFISSYMEQKLMSIVDPTHDRPLDVNGCTRGLVEFSRDLTRELSELYGRPGRFDPKYDWRRYPGKVDHTTCLTFRVGLRGNTSRSERSMIERPKRSDSLSKLTIDADDPYRDLWDLKYGSGTHAVGWEEFVANLMPNASEAEQSQVKKIIDNSNTNVVTQYKFMEFMNGFGPQEKMIENVMLIAGAPWFHGYLSGDDSMRLLDGEPPGTYLIRFSGSRPGLFVLDYITKTNKGTPSSVRLTGRSHQSGGGFTAPSKNKTIHFPTIHDMVKAYSDHGILSSPYSSKFASAPWFWGDITSEECVRKLMGKPTGTFMIRFSANGHYAASFVMNTGAVSKGLIYKTPGGFRVENSRQEFPTMEDIVKGYQASGVFTQPLTHA
ncbi:hypothetical protein PROFUN_00401 [Planoprotostelium fungivorum]|uniref:SH2 domain-containing protein n=1 Tax=Planoprotostelium fungivorum TaxID=1890364 RepID=A0A2P6NY99_9EUKA|nr:hypothetical protein PROFUN_00401 [Planoprotostelium fungivorum]